jgi:hypothetical protein
MWVLGVALLACNSTEPATQANPNGLIPVQGEDAKVGDYRLEGSRLLFTHGPDTSWDCSNGDYARNIGRVKTDTSYVRVEGDSLFIESQPSDLLSPGVFMKSVATFPRVGVGNGLQGTWRVSPIPSRYVYVSGPVSDSILRSYASRAEYRYYMDSYTTADYIFTATEARIRAQKRSADMFLDDWNGGWNHMFPADSSYYAITVTVAARDSVSLTGQRTGEVVGISFEPAISGVYTIRNYSNSNPARPPFQDPSPSGCPANNWYETFLVENLKPAATP